jgi:hypothetical protein
VFTTYRVDTYPDGTPIADLIDTGASSAELRLITCRGDFDVTPDLPGKVVVSAKLSGVHAS